MITVTSIAFLTFTNPPKLVEVGPLLRPTYRPGLPYLLYHPRYQIPTATMDPSSYRETTINFVSPLKDIGWDSRPVDIEHHAPPSKMQRHRGPMKLLDGAAKVALDNLGIFDDAYLRDLPANCKAAIWQHQSHRHPS